MTSRLDRITTNPQILGGRPCIRGMRVRVKDILDMLAGGASRTDHPWRLPLPGGRRYRSGARIRVVYICDDQKEMIDSFVNNQGKNFEIHQFMHIGAEGKRVSCAGGLIKPRTIKQKAKRFIAWRKRQKASEP